MWIKFNTLTLRTTYRYIQMSGMIVGGYLEAERRMWAYQYHMRHQRRIARDTEVWRRFEEDYEERGTPGVGAESHVHRKE